MPLRSAERSPHSSGCVGTALTSKASSGLAAAIDSLSLGGGCRATVGLSRKVRLRVLSRPMRASVTLPSWLRFSCCRSRVDEWFAAVRPTTRPTALSRLLASFIGPPGAGATSDIVGAHRPGYAAVAQPRRPSLG